VRRRTIHWRYNLKTQFTIAVYCHVLVAEGGRETFARLLRGRHLSDNEDFISIDPIAEVPIFSKSSSAASSKAQTGKCYGVCTTKQVMTTNENGGKLKILGERIILVGFNDRSMLSG
jgi:hypothetical protein